MRHPPLLASALALTLLASSSPAQSNGIPGLDVRLADMTTITALGRSGTYPNGVNGVGGATTICNVGTVLVDWFGAMDARHPFIALVVARESSGRLVQISDRAFIKHGYTSTNSAACGTCTNPGTGTKLGLNCSDTYSATLNGNSYYLAPPDEVDPWLGTWNPVGSHFDRGEPDVGAPANADGVRSLTMSQASALGVIAHRMRILDQDLAVSGARFWYQGCYIVKGELDAARENNLSTREFVPAWGGSSWSLPVTGTRNDGSILSRWSGASLASASNGGDDGRFYVAVKVTGPVAGRYHYEYAIQNRDNRRGGAAFRIPICGLAQVWNQGFRDVDQVASNEWTFQRTGSEIVWSTTGAPLLWNSFYNVWFDSDAAPANAGVLVDEFAAGAGLPSVAVASKAPLELNNLTLGPGCGAPAPALYATGNPPRALLGNASFGLQMEGVAAGASCQLFLSASATVAPLGSGCSAYVDFGMPVVSLAFVANAQGSCALPLAVPLSASLEGALLAAQGCEYQPGSGAWFGYYDLSNGLAVRIGNSLPGCP